MPFLNLRRHGATVSIGVWIVALALHAAPVAAATYPAAGGTFAADAQGWQATDASCSIPVAGACSASGSHDSSGGNPPGSLAAETSVALNLGGLFQSTVVFESPDFVVAESGAAVIHVDRQFASSGLVALVPEAGYTVSLIDRGTETPTAVIGESLGEAETAFAGKDGLTSVVAGRSYAISIAADIGSSVAGLGVLGDAAVRFDNAALSVQGASGEGGGEVGNGETGAPGAADSSALTSSNLRTLVRRNSPAGASLSGRHVFVKVRCPRRLQRACRITAQGKIRKRVRVTHRRTVRVAQGRSRVIALRVRPRFRDRVAKRKRLLIVQRVRVGEVTTTFSRSRALIRRR